jgi:hypothetical protein
MPDGLVFGIEDGSDVGVVLAGIVVDPRRDTDELTSGEMGPGVIDGSPSLVGTFALTSIVGVLVTASTMGVPGTSVVPGGADSMAGWGLTTTPVGLGDGKRGASMLVLGGSDGGVGGCVALGCSGLVATEPLLLPFPFPFPLSLPFPFPPPFPFSFSFPLPLPLPLPCRRQKGLRLALASSGIVRKVTNS